jgi:chloramphenicol O-acetyltransferase type B
MVSLAYLYAKFIKKCRGTAILNSRIDLTSRVEPGSTVINTSMSKHSFCGYDCSIQSCSIGAFSSIGSKVSIGGAVHPMHFVSTSPVFLSHKDSIKAKFANHSYLPEIHTTIGNDVWICDGVYIKAGINIGDGAIVGMGAIVTKDVAPFSIVAGNPATHIRMRFDTDIVVALTKMKWWLKSDAELVRLGPFFNNPRLMLEMEGLL